MLSVKAHLINHMDVHSCDKCMRDAASRTKYCDPYSDHSVALLATGCIIALTRSTTDEGRDEHTV